MIEFIKINPRSGIENWGSWPKDVESILKRWNKEKKLTFRRIGFWRENWIFKCDGCKRWFEPSKNGVAIVGENVLSRKGPSMALCDECLISTVRITENLNNDLV